MAVRAAPVAVLQGLPRMPWLWAAAGGVVLLAAMVLSVLVGPAHIGVGTIFQALVSRTATMAFIARRPEA